MSNREISLLMLKVPVYIFMSFLFSSPLVVSWAVAWQLGVTTTFIYGYFGLAVWLGTKG